MVTVPPWATNVARAVDSFECRDVVYVPDNPLSHLIRAFGEAHPAVRLILATREEEAFGIAAGLYLGGRRPTVMCQSSGIGNSLNAITSLLIPYRIPVLALISLRGGAGEWNSAQGPMGRAMSAMFDSIGVSHVLVESAATAEEAVRSAAARAFEMRLPLACVLPRQVTVELQ